MTSASSCTGSHMHCNPMVKERPRKGLLYMSALTSSGNKDISSPQNGVKYCPNHSLTQAITKTVRKNMLTMTMKSSNTQI